MVEAAERSGVERFLLLLALHGATTHHRARFFRAKALAEQAVREANLHSTVLAPSIVYAPGDPWLTLLERLALLPVMPVSGRGRALYQPIWAEDAADCVIAALRAPAGDAESPIRGSQAEIGRPARGEGTSEEAPSGEARHTHYELAGPETLSHNDIVRLVLRSRNRNRPLLHVPTPIVSRALRLLGAVSGKHAFATWDEAELMEVPMLSSRGAADAESLGVTPQAMNAVLGSG